MPTTTTSISTESVSRGTVAACVPQASGSPAIAMLRFSDIIDGRGDEEFEAVFDDGVEEE